MFGYIEWGEKDDSGLWWEDMIKSSCYGGQQAEVS